MYLNSKKIFSVGALEALGLVIYVRDGVLKMIRGSMVVMKGVRRDNLYYLKGSTVTGQVETSSSSDDGCNEGLAGEGRTGMRKVFVSSCKEGIIGRCCYL